jgi:protein-S-isoprenylcysteine O-methyltransferase Ste14
MLMRATNFEFRFRFWFIVSIYVVAFLSYRLDQVNASVALVKLLAGRGFDMNSLAARHAIQLVFGVSAALVLAGAWMRTWGGAYLRTVVVHDTKVRTERLVADGPFRYIRNPLYFGNLLMAAGIGWYASRTGFFALMIGQTLFVRRLIGREEAALLATQGDAYRAYQATVPRLWPSLRPCVSRGGTQPRWLQAFLGEAWIWLFGLDGVLFAWRLSVPLYYRLMWVCAAAYFLRWVVVKWLRRHSP